MASLDVFEVDHPASQARKPARVAELGMAPPPRLHYLSIDFELQTFGECLAASVVDLSRPVFLSRLGVTQYLTRDAMSQTVRDVAATTARGTEIVLPYVIPPAMRASEEGTLVAALAERANRIAEPWLSNYEPVEMEHHLGLAGFGNMVQFGPGEATERYLRGRGDAVQLPAYFRMIHAWL